MSDLTKELLAHHTFTFPSLSPTTDPNQQPYIRFLMFIKKRPDITDEKFHLWWSTVHADLAVSVAGFGGYCKRYVQLHQTAEHKRELERYGMQPLPYDGVGEIYLRSLADWVAFSGTRAFVEKLGSKWEGTGMIDSRANGL
jgi:hypothetical protein